MPELPEVERAVVRLRGAAIGRTIRGVHAHHPSHVRQLPARARRNLRGATISEVRRRGKHQLIVLADGRILHAHFRMAGDWIAGRADDPRPPHARVSIDFTDGTRVVLSDPRALSTVRLAAAGEDDANQLGPEPWDPSLTPAALRQALANRRAPIKVALLDQRIIAGIGNIYAAESLWHARIDPGAPANTLGYKRLGRLLDSVRAVLGAVLDIPDGAEDQEFFVYGREGDPCPRCNASIRRFVQAGRSTYFCPRCQKR